MIQTIENKHIEIKVKDFGAELCSARSKKNNKEYMWQADVNIWPRYSPILFPIVGELKENYFTYQNKKFELNRHGFARNSLFELQALEQHQIVHKLINNTKTKSVFPFDFSFLVKHSLRDKTLTVTFDIQNLSNTSMPFSVGGHPAFAVSELDQVSIRFNKVPNSPPNLLKRGLISDETLMDIKSKNLTIEKNTFNRDALAFIKSGIQEATLIEKGIEILKLSFADMPYLGIWSKPNAPFICIEPWNGVADFWNSTNDLFQKEGIKILAPYENFTCGYKITFYDEVI